MSRAIVVSKLYKTFDEAIPNISTAGAATTADALEDNEVRVVNKAASVNYFDLLMLVGKLPRFR